MWLEPLGWAQGRREGQEVELVLVFAVNHSTECSLDNVGVCCACVWVWVCECVSVYVRCAYNIILIYSGSGKYSWGCVGQATGNSRKQATGCRQQASVAASSSSSSSSSSSFCASQRWLRRVSQQRSRRRRAASLSRIEERTKTNAQK